ncbi:glycine N-acyltransferase-like protein 2 isoform X2 [Lingula anatina]|nr:glycine N-acyltransferase-like protein 2 isoform X2 [Lingula anatina]|eukprot:XP_013391718.1 glycine N-acyltransferase-like protein 2 isoform X2 [Lingula anatina]
MMTAIQNSQNKSSKFPNLIYTDSWPSFSVVISKPDKMKNEAGYHYLLMLYVVPDKKEKVLDFLQNSAIIDWSESMVLVCPSPLCHVLAEVAKVNGVNLVLNAEEDCHIFYTSNEESLLKTAIPDSLTEGVLSAEHSHQVNSEWKFGGTERKRTYIQSLIENLPTVALFTTQGQCIAYMITNEHGGMGMLYVTPEHRGKGCAKYVITTLAKKHLQVGHNPFLYIETDNEASLLLHLKCGFQMIENLRVRFVPHRFHQDI